MPRAINSVVVRIAIFYIGSIVLLALLLPYTAYTDHESPFVTFFSKIGFRRRRHLDERGGAHRRALELERRAVLHGPDPAVDGDQRQRAEVHRARCRKTVCHTAASCSPAWIGLFGIVLNAVKPNQAFEIVLHIAAVGIVAAWATIVACQLRLYRLAQAGGLERPKFRMPLSPYSGYVTLAFLVGVLILMMFDEVQGPWMMARWSVGVPALIGGWFLVRNRVKAAAEDAIPALPPTDPSVAA